MSIIYSPRIRSAAGPGHLHVHRRGSRRCRSLISQARYYSPEPGCQTTPEDAAETRGDTFPRRRKSIREKSLANRRIELKVLVTGRLPDEVMELIKKEHEVEAHREDRPMDREKLLAAVRDKDGLLCNISDAVNEELLSRAPKLKMIANFGVGFNKTSLH